jgi:hypothetical protein
VNTEKIRRKLSGGFRPLVIRTSDGREFELPHPEFIAIGKYEVAVVDKDGDIDLLDPLHFVSLKSGAGRNGGSRKTRSQ